MRYDRKMKILGIDEVGRGPWAGPLVVGACVLLEPIEGLTDSKKLTKKRREELNEIILAKSAWGLGWIAAKELDTIGLSAALKKAAIEAADQIKSSYTEIVIDGTVNFLADTRKGRYVSVLMKADLLVPAVSAASIIAKVARDHYMCELAEKYPEYSFEKHVGYGTKTHKQAIWAHGICPEHRVSFRPIAEYLGGESGARARNLKNTTSMGMAAEGKVAEYLMGCGHKVIARNWKTPTCEIDIISIFGDEIYFTEVKYRGDESRGDGFAAITKSKLDRMKFAAESFSKCYNIFDKSPLLAAAKVTGMGEAMTVDFLALE